MQYLYGFNNNTERTISLGLSLSLMEAVVVLEKTLTDYCFFSCSITFAIEI